MAHREIPWVDPGAVPARSAHSGWVAAGVEAQPRHHHEDMLGVRVDGDPLAGAAIAPSCKLPRDHRHVEQLGAVKGVADRAGAVVAAAEPVAVPATPYVGAVADFVRGGDHAPDRRRRPRWGA